MNRKRAIVPWCIATLAFTLLLVQMTFAVIQILTWGSDLYNFILRAFYAVCLLMFVVGIILKGFGIFSARFMDKVPDKIGSIVLIIASIGSALYSSVWLVMDIVSIIDYESYNIYSILTINESIFFLAIFVFLLFIIIGSCMCKKENSKLRAFARKMWFLPAVSYFVYFIFSGIFGGILYGFYIENFFYAFAYISAYLMLGLMLAIPYFGAKKKALQPTMPVASANYVQPQPTYNPPVNPVQPQPVYTQPVAPVRPAYTQPVQPARPVYTPPVQPAQQQAKVTADANSQAQALGIYKDLLDKGTITQEDYDKKKKEILGI